MTTSALASTFRVLRCNTALPEEAHDHTHPDNAREPASERPIVAYVRTRDEAHLRLREGVKPTWFHLRRLPAAWMVQQLDPLFHRAQQRVMAVRAGLHLVETPEGALATTAPADVRPGAQFPCVTTDHGVVLAPVEWVQEIADRWGAETVQEMGELIISMSRLPKGRSGPFGWWGGSVATD